MTPELFRKKVLSFYAKQGRSFPWRPPSLKLRKGKLDSYKILVSEIMLQQTQTFRVEPKYKTFLKKFPTVKTLAVASLGEVLRAWQGLGYNRRAKYLHLAARAVVDNYGGVFPEEYEQLLKLPGIGPYTAGAVCVFAYNQPVVMIETNIRAALIHEFFPTKKKVPDSVLIPILQKAVPTDDPRSFYQGLMDYGAFLKQKYSNPSRRSKHHAVQSTFKGSLREVRGAILKKLVQSEALSAAELPFVEDKRFKKALADLVSEGLVKKRGGRYSMPI